MYSKDFYFNQLKTNISTKKLSHGHLIIGKNDIDLLDATKRLIQYTLCVNKLDDFEPCGACNACTTFYANSNPDFQELSPNDKGNITIDKITERKDSDRSALSVIQETPLISNGKAILINPAHSMNPHSQNALLKILEEPPKDSYIFLITDKPFLLFPTIHSRVTKIFMDPPNEKEISEYFLKKSLKLDKDFIQNINEYIDISNLSQEKLDKFSLFMKDMLEDLDDLNFNKKSILKNWLDDDLLNRLKILRNLTINQLKNIFFKNENLRAPSKIMELNKDQLLYLLQNLIFFESSLQKNIPLNSKLQLEVVLDVFK